MSIVEPVFELYADRGDKIDLVIRRGKKNVYVFECQSKGGYIDVYQDRWRWEEVLIRFAVYAPRHPFNILYRDNLIDAQLEAMRILELLQ